MNMGNIIYFITLAECLSFTEAAERCFITQTAMSRYIATLENHLGVKLFIRDSHNISLTEAGTIYYHGMKEITRNYSSLEQQIKRTGSNYTGGIRLGIGLYEYSYIEQFIVSFIKENPQIKLEVYRSTYLEILNRLKLGEIDVLIASEYCSKSFHSGEIKSIDLFSGSNFLYMNKKIAEKYQGLAVSEILKNENLITNSEDIGPYSNETIKLMLQNLVGYVSDKIVQTNSLQMQLKLVEIGYGIAILPNFLQEVNQFDLVPVEISDNMIEKYQMVYLKKNVNPVTKEFVKHILITKNNETEG